MVWFGSTITLKASNPGVGITEVVLRPGEEPPMHIHKNEDEWLYVLDGEVTFHVGGEDHFGKAGAFVSFPRGIAHTFSIESETGRILVINTPGGFERMFELAPRTPEEAERALAAFGMTVGQHQGSIPRLRPEPTWRHSGRSKRPDPTPISKEAIG
jgi:quercetin dioxygenase-like cupin family protein